MLFGHEHRRAREVDERALVLDQAAAGGPALRRGAGGGERLQAVEPELGHAIVRFGAAAPAPQPFVHGRRQLDHQGTSKRHASPWRTMRPAVGWWKCVPSTATAPAA